MRIRDIEGLDLKALKNLVTLKEKNKDLVLLESRKERLQIQLDQTEAEIREYLRKHPTARTLLDAIRIDGGSGNISNRRVQRPRSWLREQITATMKASKKPITPARIRDVIATKSPEQATKNLYISIFQLLRRNPTFRKTKDGWILTKK